ncbi:MAG: hypothetical protein K2L13_03175 [Opitutales bacterium]|nr:hypothetical protein [Opitutales bacterium]
MDFRLTTHRSGSIGELWTLSWPMIVASAANCLLLFIDRIVLSYYSREAFNISVECFPWYIGFWFTFFSLIGATEIFVGQYNGAKNFRKIGPIVWQMIWFSLSTYVIFVPVCVYCVGHMLAHPTADAVGYMRIVLLYTPISFITFAALGSFFVGRGKTKFITLLNLVTTIENAILDIILVFGYCGCPRLGVLGAGYATLISQITVFFISLAVFLSRFNRKKYRTSEIRFDLSQLRSCLSVGVPYAIASSINCFAFALVIKVLSSCCSFDEFTIFGITHSFYTTLMFFGDGVSRGVSALCSNYIGAQKYEFISLVLRSSLKLQSIFGSIILFISLFLAKGLIHVAFPLANTFVQSGALSLIFLAGICLLLDGIMMYLQSTLLSAGDTKFIMITNLATFLLLVVLPAYIGITRFGLYSKFLWYLFNLESITRISIFYSRYHSNKWRAIKIM